MLYTENRVKKIIVHVWLRGLPLYLPLFFLNCIDTASVVVLGLSTTDSHFHPISPHCSVPAMTGLAKKALLTYSVYYLFLMYEFKNGFSPCFITLSFSVSCRLLIDMRHSTQICRINVQRVIMIEIPTFR